MGFKIGGLKGIASAGLTGGGRGRIQDPLNIRGAFKSKKPDKPEKTAEEAALERRQRTLLDEEIEEQERRLKALTRGRLGAQSLLSGAEPTRERAATRRAGAGGGGSLLGGAGGAGGSSAGVGVGGGGGRAGGGVGPTTRIQ